jgi:hypothetical protein
LPVRTTKTGFRREFFSKANAGRQGPGISLAAKNAGRADVRGKLLAEPRLHGTRFAAALRPCPVISRSPSVVQDHVEQGAVHVQAAIVFNEPKSPKLVHEKANARPSRADHLGERLLVDLGDDGLRFSFFAEIRQQQEETSQGLFAGVEELIDSGSARLLW